MLSLKFFLIYTFIQQGCIQLMEGNRGDIYNVWNDLCFKINSSFELSNNFFNPEKKVSQFGNVFEV